MCRNRFLQNNCITVISGLESLTELHTLNLSNNRISMVEGLSGCTNLRTLNLSSNTLTTLKSVAHLAEVKMLQNLDLSKNRLCEGDEPPKDPSVREPEPWEDQIPLDAEEKERSYAVLGLLENLPNLRTLYLKGNPVVSKMERYRKNAITRLSALHYLDDRPITHEERLATEAWAQGGNDAEREEKLRQLREKEQTYEDNFAALRAKQEVARVKYAREKESKAVFAEAAEAAVGKGLGAHNVDQTKVDAIMEANAFPRGVPAWQAAAMKAPAQPVGPAVPAQGCGPHCGDPQCHESGSSELAGEVETQSTPGVKSIEDLYEFTAGVEGEELDFALPVGWDAPRTHGTEALSVGMKDARSHEELTKRMAGSSREASAVVATEEPPWASHNSSLAGGADVEEAEEASPEKSLEELASHVAEGEVNFFQMAKDVCSEVQSAAQEMQSSFQELDFNKLRERKKLVVIDDDSTEEEEHANVEEVVFTSGKENEPRVPKASSGRSALREARLAAQQAAKGGEPELCKQEGNAQPCQSSFVDAFALD